MWPCILVICCGVVPVFDSRPDNPWDAVRDVFYSHRFTNGSVYENGESLDRAPWTSWARFRNDADFFAHVTAVLDTFLKLPRSDVEEQPAIRRAILLRDLWPVFDAQFDGPAAYGVAGERTAKLCSQVGQIMRRLELTDALASHLLDNYQMAIKAKSFLTAFDAKSPEKGFLPVDLFDEAGPWVAIARHKKTIGGLGHTQSVQYRSDFVPYIRVSAKRQDAIDYLNKFHWSPQSPPKGTQFAFVRRMVLPTDSGHIVATPVIESVQIIVTDPPRDHHYKFVLNRAALIAGQPGLRQLTADDTVDAYGFEAAGLFGHESKSDTDGEQLVLGVYAGPVPAGITSLGHCIQCHGRSMGSNIFANFGTSNGATAMASADQLKIILSNKEASPEWKAYQAAIK
jgi:hypothetical protein